MTGKYDGGITISTILFVITVGFCLLLHWEQLTIIISEIELTVPDLRLDFFLLNENYN